MPVPLVPPAAADMHPRMTQIAEQAMVEAMKAGVPLVMKDFEAQPIDLSKLEVMVGENTGNAKAVVIDSLANTRPLGAADLLDPALQRATMHILGCNSMKEVKRKFAAPCACKSGKKFKNCCLQKALAEANSDEPVEPKPVRGRTEFITTIDDAAFFGGDPGMRGSHPPYRTQEEAEK